MGEQEKSTVQQEYSVGGYKIGDYISGYGQVVSPDRAGEPGVKQILVDTNLNRIVDNGDTPIYVMPPSGIMGMVSSWFSKMSGMIPAFRPQNPSGLVEPQDEVSQAILQLDDELTEAEKDIRSHYTFATLEELKKVQAHLEEVRRTAPNNAYLAERQARFVQDVRAFVDSEFGRNADEAQDALSKGLLFGRFDTTDVIRPMHTALERYYQGRELQPDYEVPQPQVEKFRQTLTQVVEVLENRAKTTQKLSAEEAEFVDWGKHQLDTFHGGRKAPDTGTS